MDEVKYHQLISHITWVQMGCKLLSVQEIVHERISHDHTYKFNSKYTFTCGSNASHVMPDSDFPKFRNRDHFIGSPATLPLDHRGTQL